MIAMHVLEPPTCSWDTKSVSLSPQVAPSVANMVQFMMPPRMLATTNKGL